MVGKYNQNHDAPGRFATADDAVGVVGHPARKPRPTGVQDASSETVTSDAGGSDIAQIIEPEPSPIEQPVAGDPAETRPGATNPSSSNEGPSETARFSSEDLLDGHFEDHGSDFGATIPIRTAGLRFSDNSGKSGYLRI